jgi:hypothetical protein
MELSTTFGTSEKLEIEGVWRDIGDGASIKVARMGNRQHEKISQRLLAPHKAAQRTGKLSDDLIEKIGIKVMSQAILLDWKGMKDEGADLPPYTPDEGVKILTKYKDFRNLVSSISGDMSNFQEEQEAAAGKNLPSSSPGS